MKIKLMSLFITALFVFSSCNPFLDDILNAGKGDKKEIWLGYKSLDEAMAWLLTQPTGDAPQYPVTLALNMPLGEMPSSQWQALLSALRDTGKYVNLDLSACAITDKVFDPYVGGQIGQEMIVSLVLPKQAQSIANSNGYSAYDYFDKLTQVSGANVKNINDTAFAYCSALKTVNMPAATTIGNSAFHNCSSLEIVNLPKATYTGSNSFDNCTSLINVTLPNATTIGDGAFDNCTSLTSVSLPKATTIGILAFELCTSLININLPEATTIDSGAFDRCTNLATVDLPKAGYIGQVVFDSCTSLTSVNIPSIRDIDRSAFSNTGTQSLTITMGVTAPALGTDMFDSVNANKPVTVKVPAGATGYTPFTGTAVTIELGNANMTWANGFRGMGWPNSTPGSGNSNITLIIEPY